MKVLTRSIAFAGTLLAAPCVEAQNYFQRSTLFEHTEPTTGFELAVETADGGVLTTLDADTALYLVKLDPNGDPLWANTISPPAMVAPLVQDLEGHFHS
ncbi:MAG: hypothetical protein IPG10_13720 [Flavobacteriales bacterium]|nr:hypothetical protein [Flavobacteriales bacterium]